MPGRTAWVLGDQLSHANPVLHTADRVLMVEYRTQLRKARFHRQKLHLVLSAMRHFAQELRERGVEVDYRVAPTLTDGLREHQRAHRPDEVALLLPHNAGAAQWLGGLEGVRIVSDTLFLTHPDEFADWAGAHKGRLVMEPFYRWQRRRLDVLMDGDDPVGGRWNLDAENRRPPPRDRRPPERWTPTEDEIDAEVRRDLDALNLPTFGRDRPRLWPATRAEAEQAMRHFVEERLPTFGPWQDAMLGGERWMWHSLLSSSLNLNLLSPLEPVRAAEAAYRAGHVPLQSAEGYVRQVIGWREYIWGTYWLLQERWPEANALGADIPLPEVFWGGRTDMNCMSEAIGGLHDTAYAHHIERLMLFGNLMLLLGVRPHEAVEWFQVAFVDGYDWVMAPNVLGMGTYADGGRMMTKPYAATGRYVQRMSDHCLGCRYNPTKRVGDDACPYTNLYWDFLERHRERLGKNHRLRNVYANLARMDRGELGQIQTRAAQLREHFDA